MRRYILSVLIFGLLASARLVRAQDGAEPSELEEEILQEHNLARTDPQGYALFLEDLREYFDGKLLVLPGDIPLRTEEGWTAVEEAIRFLRSSEALPRLTASRGMSRGAQDHVMDQGRRTGLSHTGTDGSQPWTRIERYGTWFGSVAENITYGPAIGREVVMQLIIDDGVPGRGHRQSLFNPRFQVLGVSCGYHLTYETMCVVTYAEAYLDRQ